MPSSRGSSQSSDGTQVSYLFCIAGDFFTSEPPEKPQIYLVAQSVNNLPIAQEIQVPSLSREVPLEKEMANHFSILAWKTPWTEDPSGLQSMIPQESDMTEQLNHHIFNIDYDKPYCIAQGTLLNIS